MARTENVLYNNYIKYDQLYHITIEGFYGSTNTDLNIFIDMPSLVRRLYREMDREQISASEIASSIINLCAHLRKYYRTRHCVYARFFIIYADNYPKNVVERIPSYNGHYKTEVNAKQNVTGAIMEALSILNIITPYLTQVYFIRDTGEHETSVVIHEFIQFLMNIGDFRNCIIYSKDPYAYQVVALNQRCILMRPKKNKEGDCSYVVTKSSLFKKYWDKELKLKSEPLSDINPGLFSFFIALSGFRCRDIKYTNITSVGAMKILSEGIQNKNILNCHHHVVNEYLLSGLGIVGLDAKDFVTRYECLDLEWQNEIYKLTPQCILNTNSMRDFVDPVGIQLVNDKYFKDCPLDLMELM